MSKQRRILIAKAEPVGIQEIPDMYIQIRRDITIPTFKDDPDWMQLSKAFHASQAHAIVEALVKSLPGGTLDCVIAELFKRRSCLFKVPIGDM